MLWRGATLRSRVFGRLKKHVVQRRAQKARLVCACASVPWFSVTSKGCHVLLRARGVAQLH